MSFKIAKMIVGFTIVKFCKRGCQMGDGGGGGRGGRLIFEDCVHKGSLNMYGPGMEVFHFNFEKHVLI